VSELWSYVSIIRLAYLLLASPWVISSIVPSTIIYGRSQYWLVRPDHSMQYLQSLWFLFSLRQIITFPTHVGVRISAWFNYDLIGNWGVRCLRFDHNQRSFCSLSFSASRASSPPPPRAGLAPFSCAISVLFAPLFSSLSLGGLIGPLYLREVK